jgi:hypothetical protein
MRPARIGLTALAELRMLDEELDDRDDETDDLDRDALLEEQRALIGRWM